MAWLFFVILKYLPFCREKKQVFFCTKFTIVFVVFSSVLSDFGDPFSDQSGLKTGKILHFIWIFAWYFPWNQFHEIFSWNWFHGKMILNFYYFFLHCYAVMWHVFVYFCLEIKWWYIRNGWSACLTFDIFQGISRGIRKWFLKT